MLRLFFFYNVVYAKEVPGCPTTPTGKHGGKNCQQFEAHMTVASGNKTFIVQTQTAVSGIPRKLITSAEFNCGSFQVMCYTIVTASNFTACIDQAGRVIADPITTPSSTPNQVCSRFNAGALFSQVGYVTGWYSNCS